MTSEDMVTTIGYMLRTLGETVEHLKAEHKAVLAVLHYHPEKYPDSLFFDLLDGQAVSQASYAASPDEKGLSVYRVPDSQQQPNLLL